MPALHKMKKQVESIPNYPGRKQLEAVTRPVVELVGGRWIRHHAEKQVLRLVGYHTLWHALASYGVKSPGREMVRRKLMADKTEYDFYRDFELVFGALVEDMTHDEVMAKLGAHLPPLPGQVERRRARPSKVMAR